jgi:transglutaminase-like putative cysteine protease
LVALHNLVVALHSPVVTREIGAWYRLSVASYVLLRRLLAPTSAMEFEVTHTTHYRYSHPAAEAYGEARLTAPDLPTQTILSHRLVLNPEVETSKYEDHFGNVVNFFSLPFRHRRLVVTNRLVVQTHAVPQPHRALELSVQETRQILNSALTDTFDYLQPTPVVEMGRESYQWARKYLRGDRALGEALQELTQAIHREFRYQSGSTENSTPLATVWKMRKGVCQDLAHIGLSVLRIGGLPARYVCGYIETDPPLAPDGTPQPLTGAVATHAWIEVLVPGMQWVAIDPTNDQWVNERYVAVSFGRDYRDAAPIRGTFKGSGGQQMRIRVLMKRRPTK